MNHVTEKKLNNKGFSLVELIIVVAIMAVLIGVLAPQYLKYVERSRVSTDRDNVDSIVSALQVYAVDPDASSAFAGGETITLTRTAAPSISDSADTPVTGAIASSAKNTNLTIDADIQTALNDAGIAFGNLQMKSDLYDTWTITFAADKVTFSSADDGVNVKKGLGR